MLYTTVSIFEMTSPKQPPLYREELSAINANSDEEAKTRAIAQGKASEHSYENGEGETITVSFKTLVDVQEPLEAIPQSEGVIYARHFRDYQAYETFEPMLRGAAL